VKFLENEMLTFQKTLSQLKKTLGEEKYLRELEAGRALALEQAIELTLQLNL
jgi:hypothetical protein